MNPHCAGSCDPVRTCVASAQQPSHRASPHPETDTKSNRHAAHNPQTQAHRCPGGNPPPQPPCRQHNSPVATAAQQGDHEPTSRQQAQPGRILAAVALAPGHDRLQHRRVCPGDRRHRECERGTDIASAGPSKQGLHACPCSAEHDVALAAPHAEADGTCVSDRIRPSEPGRTEPGRDTSVVEVVRDERPPTGSRRRSGSDQRHDHGRDHPDQQHEDDANPAVLPVGTAALPRSEPRRANRSLHGGLSGLIDPRRDGLRARTTPARKIVPDFTRDSHSRDYRSLRSSPSPKMPAVTRSPARQPRAPWAHS